MLRVFCIAKIHKATITGTELQYSGSITIDTEILDAVGMYPYERVQVLNLNNGERLETYIIPGKAGSREIILNGPAARKGTVGDKIMIVAYGIGKPEEFPAPTVVELDDDNNVIKR